MGTNGNRIVHKHFRLNPAKIRRAQKVMKTRTETETIERALDAVIAEDERNRVVYQATVQFLKSGIKIKDVYGKLTE